MDKYHEITETQLQSMISTAVEIAISNLTKDKQSIYINRKTAAKRLGVDVSTLWRWGQMGYLKPIHRGGRVWFAESDIVKIEKGEMKA